jgi:hypothetical protein
MASAGEICAGVGAGKSAKKGIEFAEETVALKSSFCPLRLAESYN